MISRTRAGEALDEAYRRAHGYPHDHAIQDELLSAMESDASRPIEGVHPLIRWKRVPFNTGDPRSTGRTAAPIKWVKGWRSWLWLR